MCRHGNGLHRSCWLLVNLAPLTLLALPAHGCHVFAHAFPNKTCRQHPSCSTYAWMCHVMDGVEDGRPVLNWHQWPGDATCHVTQQAGSLYLTDLTDREEDLAACSVLGQRAWLAAILWKDTPVAGCTSATFAATPGNEGVEEFSLPPCRATT